MHCSGKRVRTSLIPAAVGALVVGIVGLAGCGSSSPSSSSTAHSTPSSGTAAATASTTRAAGGASDTAAGGTSNTMPGGASDTAAIEKAYEVFFAPNAGNASMDHLQNGEQFQAVLNQQGQSESSLAASASAHVSKVTLISPTVAKVIFTIEVGGKPMLQNQPGYAVKQDGTWKVSDYTFCGLLHLEMGSKVPSVCDSAVATHAPS
ncbi:MAG: hypothetical protein BGO26_06160 [Actinobacteria bacterium 69-20]|jgi:hypothetical protein|nr:hypothetical protein [Actinomycetota bacterium]OJV28042.1 MAG: hypothetical protein BGO26_06160 [Actinobacteria bacterium 69-20]